MGFNTDYLGHLTVTPRLNPAEVQWLLGFAAWGGIRDGDPFSLPMNPRAELDAVFAAGRGAVPSPAGIPRGVSDWQVCGDGGRIVWRRSDKSNDAVQTLDFLVSHYLGPDALAQQADNPDFAAFTFDHRLDGVIAGCRHDTDELFLLEVDNSRITWTTLVPGTAWW
jgi:hypothetical protein